MKRLASQVIPFALAAALALPAFSLARTKLVTLPDRATMVVNLEHPSQSLLHEERDITLQQGTNFVDFSWQGVSIDRDSIRLELLSNPGDGPQASKIIHVAFPPNEPALTWQIYSPEARTERIRVSYLLHGITRESSYEMTVNAAEDQAIFQQYFQMTNASGEDLNNSAFRIRQTDDLERSVENGETRRFLAFQQRELPIRKLFVTRPDPYSTRGEDGEIISLVYEIENAKTMGLGTFKLDPGKTRIYGEAPDGSTIFLGEDYLKETPTGEEAQLTLGTVKDVVLKRRIMNDKQENQRRNNNKRVVLYDRVVHLRYEIENFKDKAATVRVIETIPPDAKIIESDDKGVKIERKSGSELQIDIDLEPRPAGSDEDVPVREINIVYKIENVMG
ncbi:MAG: hypothetical protein PWP23_1455 [Candidatus Sumerlaeota bacterium]|nr:hypothetical protein [Candidatus Sumerlaeota bacterium]